MKNVAIVVTAVLVAWAAQAAPEGARAAMRAHLDAKVRIGQMPQIGPQSLVPAPQLQAQGGSSPISKKRRNWGVYEMKYRTAAKWTEDLTVEWYVMSDTTRAKEVDRSKAASPLPNYVYYTASIHYLNIPEGDHMSCVVLPPSFVERYGEPVVISCVVLTREGKQLDCETVVNGVPGIVPGKIKPGEDSKKWWANDKVINAKKKNGEPLVELRQGLLERSKSPFALVNSADYEVVQ